MDFEALHWRKHVSQPAEIRFVEVWVHFEESFFQV